MSHGMHFVIGGLAAGMLCLAGSVGAAERLEAGFANPPAETKPSCYWYWISDNLSKEGITRDLEAMARVGIGEAFIGNIFLGGPAGDVKVLSEPWWRLVEHAIREGGRVGVQIGLFNCPGWSQSGGPWIKPDQAMRHLVSSEMRVRGPAKLDEKLPAPKTPFQDVAVLAFPAPLYDADTLAQYAPRITCTPAAPDAALAADGRLDTALVFPPGAGQGKNAFRIEIETAQPLTARSLGLIPAEAGWAAQCELQMLSDEGTWRSVRSFKFDRSNMEIGVGPMPRGPVVVSFPPATARRFRLLLSGVRGRAALAEIQLSGAARLESFVEKQLGKMHPTPLPLWDTYLWPTPPEPDRPALAVPAGAVLDLTDRLEPGGRLRWDVPAGEYVVQRIGMTPTGTKNAPASPEGQGLEVDKMNRAAAEAHFDAFLGRVLARMPAADRRAFTRVVADSYEMGPQNWTDGFAGQFRQRYGYDPQPWLPVLTGRIVGSADQAERFLWDLRRLVADRVALDYVGGLRDCCRQHGLQLWLENYGHWGFPSEFLKYGGQSDAVGGEYWVTGELGSIECRAASSCANTYGKPRVSAESFTGGPAFQNAPAALKARGDWAFCEGINHFVLHVYIHQPWENRRPGVNAWFGTEFNRHNTWFAESRAWIDCLRRCCWLLQQGTRVADVAYFIGEDTPKMTGLRQPELPAGRDFDYINAEIIEQRLTVQNGLLALPHGTTYRVLVLPEQPTMRPTLLRKIRDLVRQGATVLGSPPERSPSREDFPACDSEVRQLAAELWGDLGGRTAGERRFGQGRIVRGRTLDELFAETGVSADFTSRVPLRFTHRTAAGTDIYFIANPRAEHVTTTVALRIADRAPELWWPDSGRIERPAVYDVGQGTVRLPLSLGPHGSAFVVLREKAAAERIVEVTRNGARVLDTALPTPAPAETLLADSFAMAVWVKPTTDTPLPPETNTGVHGVHDKRNDVVTPPHGDTFSAEGGHAGCGLAVGRNGVCVLEHGAGYFAPVLVHAAPLSDWTHVAVVYRDGRPRLYLNGAFVRQGLQSNYRVHCAATSPGGSPQFRGRLGSIATSGGALDEAAVAQWAKTMPRPGTHRPGAPLELTRGATGDVVPQVWQAGTYTWKTADGRTRTLAVPSVSEPTELSGPWEVAFDPQRGGPERTSFAKLDDWAQRPEDGIRHYSGQALYRKQFQLPPPTAGQRVFLDLGEVRDIAVVRLNGQHLGTLWMAPRRVEITAAVRAADNELEITVINCWNNRLVGDAALPPEQRRTFLTTDTVKKDTPLQPAGLLGPVVLSTCTIPTP